MFSPLHIDCDLGPVPWSVKDCAMPVGPHISRRVRRVVSDPHDLLVSRNRERNPRSVDVVPPQQVVGDYPLGWVENGRDPGQREPFVTLKVQDRCEAPRQHGATIGSWQVALYNNGSQRDVGARSASAGHGDY